MQKLEKISLRYLKTDHGRTHGPTDDRGDYIGPLQINRGLKYKLICRNKACFAILAQVFSVKLSYSYVFIGLRFAVTCILELKENNDLSSLIEAFTSIFGHMP